ncbi:MAG: bifunctional phosphoribosylaminoimidazolecarboxamide formyltransferase/IMP cyclohydrolase PurH [Chitinophagia bacterium]|nr:bifunctional phosphoribosylaminoimidazolecarboxamide formyltransferase/IMP cyclohydrolase PurH [Chitinophagia bacterium]
MDKSIKSALITVYNKEGIADIARQLHANGTVIYSTGGTHDFLLANNIPCVAVENITDYPSIFGGRVKTLHPKVFGGILARRQLADDLSEASKYQIPLIDLVIVDLYPFEETVLATSDEATIIEKIDIGGVSLIRAAAKNFNDVLVVPSRKLYADFAALLASGNGTTTLADRKKYAAAAFTECAHYDVMIASYFKSHGAENAFQLSHNNKVPLRYGENPHQQATFFGYLHQLFHQLNGKELSYNNLVDIDAATQIIAEFTEPVFAIVKHTNVCGIAVRATIQEAWTAAYTGDPESAFGGVLATNRPLDLPTARLINTLFFEVLLAPAYDEGVLDLLKEKKNRIILVQQQPFFPVKEYKRIFNGVLLQDSDTVNTNEWREVGARETTEAEKADLIFANKVCKHLKSNAIAIVKDGQLIGKGCGQTSRVDALKQAIEKAQRHGFSTEGAVLSSDAFFPFDDCVKLAHAAGISAIIQPGGSVRDNDSIAWCVANGMAMVLTGTRHFKH